MNMSIKSLINRNLFLLFIFDAVIILSSIYLSILFRFDFVIPVQINELFTFQNIIIFTFIKIIIFMIFSLYRGMWRYTSIWDMFNIIKANIFSTLLLAFGILITIGFENFSRSLLIIDIIICTGLISISRLVIRVFFSHVLRYITINSNLTTRKKIILIGAGDTGQSILRQSTQKYNSSIKVVGFIDDDLNKTGRAINGIQVLGNVNKLKDFNYLFDEIYICIPSASRKQMRNIIKRCKDTAKPFKTLPSLSELIEGKVSINQFREVSVVDLLRRKEISLDKTSINKFIQGKRVIVTGAGGSIGSELVRQCLRFKPSVLMLLDCSELNLFEIEREISDQSSNILFKPILSDIRDLSVIKDIFDEYRPQIVFHAAAYKHVPMQEKFPLEAVKTNIFGTFNLAELSIKYEVEKFVLVSTDKAVRPTNVMGATKRLAEIIIQNANQKQEHTDFMAVRFGNVLGSSGSVIPIFKEQIKNGGPVTITDPDMERYFMSIPEAGQLILQAGSLGKGGEVFILDMGKTIKIIDLAFDLIRLSGYEPGDDIPIEITGTRPGEKKIEELSLPSEKLDRTKHNKIFVLINNKTKNSFEKISNQISDLKKGINQHNSKKIKIILSSILKEYKPEIKYSEEFYPLKEKAEA